jgi:hypothetical protein
MRPCLVVHGFGQILRDTGDHVRQLDRDGDVVDEVDQHSDVDQRQREHHGDRHVRHSVRTARDHPSG